VKIVAVTSCPTGIAHTYMAAEALEKAAKARGHEIVVETQGSGGAETAPDAAIRDADVFIQAADAGVSGLERFAHLPKVEVRVGEAINKTAEVLDRAEAAARQPVAAGAATTGNASAVADADAPVTAPAGALREEDPVTASASSGGSLRRWLMTGVSYMIPFVTAGGILIALAFALGGAVEVTEVSVYEEFTVARMLLAIGGAAFGMLVPILAGFIAYAMADRPASRPASSAASSPSRSRPASSAASPRACSPAGSSSPSASSPSRRACAASCPSSSTRCSRR
jgi:fructose PTS system EIIBC or EIIC component